MKKRIIITLLPLFFLGIAANCGAVPAYDIWEGRDMPGNKSLQQDKTTQQNGRIRVEVLNSPRIEFYKADSDNPCGAVIVCPGGGYKVMCWDYEGTDIAESLAKNGISAFVLAYRVPDNRDGALMDAQRAIRYIRAHAKDFNINPDKVAIMGFSAGGHLSSRCANGKDSYKSSDARDKFSALPNYTGLIYPAYLNKPNEDGYEKDVSEEKYDTRYELSPHIFVDKKTPSSFLVSTGEDYCIDASIAYYLALKKAGVPACLHLFDKGKHGFAADKKNLVSQWFDLYVKWLKHNGF